MLDGAVGKLSAGELVGAFNVWHGPGDSPAMVLALEECSRVIQTQKVYR